MENHQILDISKDIHLFALHHVFEPRISRDLSTWRNAHNNHKMRTENNKSPRQLWHENLIVSSHNTYYSAIRNIFSCDEDQRRQQIDDFRSTNNFVEPSDIAIVIPRIPPPLTEQQLEDLSSSIDVLADSQCNGIDIYGQVVTFISHAQRI